MRTLPFLTTIGLLAACSEAVPAIDSETGAGGTEAATSGAAAEVALAAVDAPLAEGSAQPADAASVASLPLRRGFFVATDTSCGQASNATLMLVRRGGINTSRVPCDFEAIEKIGSTSYRVTERCSMGGAAWGTQEEVDRQIRTYEIASDTSFTARSDDGGSYSARYCAQPSLPEPWRNNDISDIID